MNLRTVAVSILTLSIAACGQPSSAPAADAVPPAASQPAAPAPTPAALAPLTSKGMGALTIGMGAA